MSSDADAGPGVAEIVDIYQSVFTVSSFQFCVVAFLLYDYLVALEREIELFWRRKFSGASVLFFFTRYSTLIAYDFLGTATLSHLSDTRYACRRGEYSDTDVHDDYYSISCALLTRAQYAFTTIQYVPWAAFSALRVLALSGMRWPLAILVFLLSLVPAGVSFSVYAFNLTGVNILTTGCQGESDVTAHQNNMCVVSSDAIVLAVTLWATWNRGTRSLGKLKRTSLADVLLYDGVLYFATLFTLNVLDLILNQISVVTPYHTASYITILSDPLTAVLVYRFLLDLQAANLASIELRSSALPSIAVDTTSATGAGGSTLRFASHIVEPFGTSLLPGATSYGSADDQLFDHEYDTWVGGQTGPDAVEDAAHAEAAAQVPNLKQGGAGDIELPLTAIGEEMEGEHAALPSAR